MRFGCHAFEAQIHPRSGLALFKIPPPPFAKGGKIVIE